MRHKKKRYLPWKCGIFSLFGASSRLLVATSKGQFFMRHKKKCGPPRSKSYCATKRNATTRRQFCHFGLLLASSWGPPPPPPTSCQKLSVFPSSHTKNLAAPGPSPFWNFYPFWGFISVACGHLQGAILNAPQEETLLTMEMWPSKEQIILCHKKKCY